VNFIIVFTFIVERPVTNSPGTTASPSSTAEELQVNVLAILVIQLPTRIDSVSGNSVSVSGRL